MKMNVAVIAALRCRRKVSIRSRHALFPAWEYACWLVVNFLLAWMERVMHCWQIHGRVGGGESLETALMVLHGEASRLIALCTDLFVSDDRSLRCWQTT